MHTHTTSSMYFVLLVRVSKAGYMGAPAVPSCMLSVQCLEKLTSKNLIFRRVSFCEDKYKKSKMFDFKNNTKKCILLYSVRELKSGGVGFRIDFVGDQGRCISTV